MNKNNNLHKPAFTLTVSELIEELKKALVGDNANIAEAISKRDDLYDPRYEHSSIGISKRLGISVTTFHQWKNENLFSYTQVGRKCIYDVPLIMSELKEILKKKSR